MSEKNKVLSIIFLCSSIVSIALFIIFLTALLTIPYELEGLIITLSCAFATFIFIFLSVIYSKGYKLKYLFLGKHYKDQVNKSLKKFNSTDEEFIKKFVKKRKDLFRKTGIIYYKDNDTYLYRDDKHIVKALELYKQLLKAIESKGGFVEFCKSTNFEDYESSWHANYLMTNNLIPNELRYLLTEVLLLTDFYVSDNGLSAEYTEINNKNIELLNNVYSPVLFNFKEDIEIAIKKIEKALNL